MRIFGRIRIELLASTGFVELRCDVLGDATSNGDGSIVHRLGFSVRDTGKGMSPEVLRGLFKPYQSIGGVGIGLYLSSNLVMALGSKLCARSPWSDDDSPGSAFDFEIDVVTASGSDSQASHGGETQSVHVSKAPFSAASLERHDGMGTAAPMMRRDALIIASFIPPARLASWLVGALLLPRACV